MKLQEKLSKLKQDAIANRPPEVMNTLLSGIQRLQDSGLKDQVIGVGSILPEFTLPDEQGNLVSSRKLLAKGPLIINFYRGTW